MAKYKVIVKEVHSVVLDVEAETPADARSKANDMLAEGVDATPEYDYTLDPEEWSVVDLSTGKII